MADRVSASITLGGTLTASAFAELVEIIADEGLSTEWDGEPFEPEDLVPGKPLGLFAHEVSGGEFETLEAWCVRHRMPFVRWCGGYPGQWGPQRVVFEGTDAPKCYAVSEDDDVVIDHDTIKELGSLAAILAYFDAAAFVTPPFIVEASNSKVAA